MPSRPAMHDEDFHSPTVARLRADLALAVGAAAHHGVIACGAQLAHAGDDLYFLRRAGMHQVRARSTGRPLALVDAPLARRVSEQTRGERLQSELFFEALGRTL